LNTPRFQAPDAIEPACSLLQDFLEQTVSSGAQFRAGELIKLSWSWLKVEDEGGDLKITAPKPASLPMEFIDDCSDALMLTVQQRYVTDSFDAGFEGCNARQHAIIIRDLFDCEQWFLNRMDPEKDASSGWFVGAFDSNRTPDTPDDLELISLWELYCRKPLMAEFFLLPVGWQVVFDELPVVCFQEQAVKPQPGSYFELKFGS